MKKHRILASKGIAAIVLIALVGVTASQSNPPDTRFCITEFQQLSSGCMNRYCPDGGWLTPAQGVMWKENYECCYNSLCHLDHLQNYQCYNYNIGCYSIISDANQCVPAVCAETHAAPN